MSTSHCHMWTLQWSLMFHGTSSCSSTDGTPRICDFNIGVACYRNTIVTTNDSVMFSRSNDYECVSAQSKPRQRKGLLQTIHIPSLSHLPEDFCESVVFTNFAIKAIYTMRNTVFSNGRDSKTVSSIRLSSIRDSTVPLFDVFRIVLLHEPFQCPSHLR